MKRLCDSGCRRPAIGEWIHPTLGAFTLAALCSMRHKTHLEATGWHYYPPLTEPIDAALTPAETSELG